MSQEPHDSSPLTDADRDALRQRLQDRSRTLLDELRAVEADRPDVPTLTQTTVEDEGERGEQRTRDAVREAEQVRDAEELRDITAALGRMDDGSYGVCVDCGTDIPAARLQAQPAAMRCVPCQERFEAAHPSAARAVLMS